MAVSNRFCSLEVKLPPTLSQRLRTFRCCFIEFTLLGGLRMHCRTGMIVSANVEGRNSLMLTRFTVLRLGLAVFAALLAGCASFAPTAYLNSSALSAIDTNRGFCVHEPSVDPKRINGSKTIQRMFGEAGFDTSCGDQTYVVEWWFESTDQRVDHAHMPTFCSGYGYWRSCTTGHGATLVTYQRTFQLVIREKITSQDTQAVDGDTGAANPRDGAVWSARLDSRGSKTDYSSLIPNLMLPILANLGQDRQNELLRLLPPENSAAD